MRENTDHNNSEYGHFLRSDRAVTVANFKVYFFKDFKWRERHFIMFKCVSTLLNLQNRYLKKEVNFLSKSCQMTSGVKFLATVFNEGKEGGSYNFVETISSRYQKKHTAAGKLKKTYM